jgi:hypothetical protein
VDTSKNVISNWKEQIFRIAGQVVDIPWFGQIISACHFEQILEVLHSADRQAQPEDCENQSAAY